MNVERLAAGDQVTLSDGSVAAVLRVAGDHQAVRVRYVDSMDNPDIPVGTESDVPAEEIIALFMGTHAEGDT